MFICGQCKGHVMPAAAACPSCGFAFGPSTPSVPAIPEHTSSGVGGTVAVYVLLVAFLPSILFLAALWLLAAMNVDPMVGIFMIVVGPALGLLGILSTAVATYVRAARFDARGRRIIRIVVLSSIF